MPVTLGYVENGVTKSTTLGTARTLADGTWTLVVKPLRSGTLRPRSRRRPPTPRPRPTWAQVTVHAAATDLVATVDRTDVGYGSGVVVTGRLTKTPWSTGLPVGLASAALKVTVTTSTGTTTTVGSRTTKADGSYTATVPLRPPGPWTSCTPARPASPPTPPCSAP